MNSSEMAQMLRGDPEVLAILERESRAMAELVARHEGAIQAYRRDVERLMARLGWRRP